MAITVVGLGPGSPGDLTLEANEVLRHAPVVWLRTRIHPTVNGLTPGPELRDFDHYYERSADFSEVYLKICGDLLQMGSDDEVVYAVPGHPLVGEATVRTLLERSRTGGPSVRIVAGLSFIESVCTALALDPLSQGLQIVDALDPALDPQRPALCAQIYSRRIASALKLTLLDMYPPDHGVALAGGGSVWRGSLSDLDRSDRFDHLSTLYLPPLAVENDLRTFGGVRGIVHRLRAPGGCPWDREQTHQSLRPYLLEETYEALEKLDAGDPSGLAEELGDLLLQIVLHCEIAIEAGEFEYSDVFESIASKLIRRHPHVFGDVSVADSEQVKSNWQRIKQEERAGQDAEQRSILSGVSPSMPALAFSQAVQERAAQVGFDWPRIDGVLEKLAEELEELRAAEDPDQREEEFGDLLFVLSNFARWLKIDAETALRRANGKFRRRFAGVEQLTREHGLDLSAVGLEQLDRFWNEIKERENG